MAIVKLKVLEVKDSSKKVVFKNYNTIVNTLLGTLVGAEYYSITENAIPEYNPNTEKISYSYQLTTDIDEIYSGLKKAYKNFTKSDRLGIVDILIDNGVTQYPTRINFAYGGISNLDSNLTAYRLIKATPIPFDSNTHELTISYNITSEIDSDTGLDIANESLSTAQLPNDNIIVNINQSLKNHLDSNYPLSERCRHLNELNNPSIDIDRKTYIESIQAWEINCWIDMDNMIDNLVNNNILPTIEWDERPS